MSKARALFSGGARAAIQPVLSDPKRRLLLVFDLDGTLAPIESHPDSARVSRATFALLSRAAGLPRVRVAIVSARPLRDLRRILPPDRRLARIAQYGLEGPLAPTVAARRRMRRAVRGIDRRIRPILAAFPGAFLEGKGLSLAVHHRGVAPGRRTALLRRLGAVARSAIGDGIGVQLGDHVYDFVPAGYHKGRAIDALRARARPGTTVYFGDSAGDEPAFAALAPTDVSVRVGPGPTAARFRVRGPIDVARFLRVVVAERSRALPRRR